MLALWADLACERGAERRREVLAAGRLPTAAGRAAPLGRAAHQRAVGALRNLAGGHRHELTENMRSDPGIFKVIWLVVLRGALPGAGPAQPDGRNGGRLRPPDPGRNPGDRQHVLDGGADDVTLATLGEVLLEPTLTTLGNFLVRSNSQSSVASASLGFQLGAPLPGTLRAPTR